MQNDFSEIRFNPNHKRESAAVEAIMGLRWLAWAIAINLVIILTMIGELISAHFLSMGLADAWGTVGWLAWLVACASGAYGIYRMADAIGWAQWATIMVIVALLIPYLGMVALIVVSSLAIAVVREGGYRFTFFGRPKRARPPPLPQ